MATPFDAAQPARAQLAWGDVRHVRHRPTRHAFAYPTAFLLLPMRALARDGNGELARNRKALLSFHDADHGDGGPDALAWIESLLGEHGIAGAEGEIWLQTFPRVARFAFKPVSFWYCHAADGRLRAVVAEVNNTMASRKLAAGPATTIAERLASDWRVKARGSSAGSIASVPCSRSSSILT